MCGAGEKASIVLSLLLLHVTKSAVRRHGTDGEAATDPPPPPPPGLAKRREGGTLKKHLEAEEADGPQLFFLYPKREQKI